MLYEMLYALTTNRNMALQDKHHLHAHDSLQY